MLNAVVTKKLGWMIYKLLYSDVSLQFLKNISAFQKGCSKLTVLADFCCSNLPYCISQTFPDSDVSVYHRWCPFTCLKKVTLVTEKFKYISAFFLFFDSRILQWCYTLIPVAMYLYENRSNCESSWCTLFKSCF